MSSEIRYITTANAPKAAGHYSQGVVHNGVVYVAGQLPLMPSTSEVIAGDVAAQTERTLRNVEAILIAGGASLSSLLSLTVYITRQDQWQDVNDAVARVLGDHRPARAVVPVLELKEGCHIEMQAVAAVR